MEREKIINTDNLKIEKNILSFNDILIQISNISSISIEPIPKKKFSIWSVLFFVLGLIGVLQKNTMIKSYGIGTLVITITYVCFIIAENYGSNAKYLYIFLNSGFLYYIMCDDEKFLKTVAEVMKDCINHYNDKNIQVDFKDCKIYNSPITVGNDTKTNNTIIDRNNFYGWKELQNELIKVSEKLPKASEEYNASEEALKYALRRDKNGLVEVVNKHSKCFMSDVFKGVASGVLVEIIKSLLL